MTHKSAGRLRPIGWPPAHVQLLIGAACSSSAPGLNEVTRPVLPAASPAGGPESPAAPAVPGGGWETWVRPAEGDCPRELESLARMREELDTQDKQVVPGAYSVGHVPGQGGRRRL